jgi:LmbE family N-acetylglucosaminyl deacetylase
MLKSMLKRKFFLRQWERGVNFFNSISTVYPRPLDLPPEARCLVLAPHPDDEAIGCGGLLLTHPEQFDVICLTDGSQGDPSKWTEDLVRERAEEFASVMGIIGIERHSGLNLEDGKLADRYSEFSKMKLAEYDYIFLPNFMDQHPDHKAVTKLLQRLLKENIQSVKPTVRFCFYEVWGALAIPNYYVDITEAVEKKEHAINQYVSQTKFIDYASRIIALNHYRGMTVNKKYVEAYCVLDVHAFRKIVVS